MDTLNKGLRKVEAALKWDPSPTGSPPMDLDLVAAVYAVDDPHQHPVYVVHFDQRAPDGTITLNRDSRTGQGFGWDEVLTLELDRLSSAYGRVVVGVAVQQREGTRTFRDVIGPEARLREGYEELGTTDFAAVPDAAAATVAEFVRAADGEWTYRPLVQGFDTDLTAFTAAMGNKPA
ncbi:TerD family protein [Streptomyces sp. NPDC049954]|uniref:TerD family protein n=1 Tax=Streptomyces sp. NPDC049954 TaxID=3155779 RepID=UPI003431BFBE